MVVAPDALVAHCRRAQRSQNVTPPGGRDASDVAGLVRWLNEKDEFGDHDTWVNLGMALRLEYGDDGLDLWRVAHDDTVTEGVEAAKWRSFATEAKPGCFTLNSLMKRAHDLGWTGAIGPSMKGCAEFAAADAAARVAGTSTQQVAAMLNVKGAPGPTDPGAEADAADELVFPTPPGGFIKGEAEFTDGFIPPDYLLDSVLQLRFCYAMTAQTGVGKTTVAMRLAAHVATEKQFCGLDVQKGTVIYFAGENPTDIQMRWIGLKHDMGLTGPVDVHFVSGAMHISKVIARITREIVEKGLKPSLIVIDTSAAFFEGQDDNGNVEQGDHARRLRALTLLPGGPCVLILAHPTKGAKTIDEMTPRGGGAFLNEVDGNIGLARVDGGPIVAQAVGKFRGPEFSPLNFKLKVIRDHPLLKDTKGRSIPTIIAEPISEAEIIRNKGDMRKKEDQILKLLCDHPGQGTVDIAKTLGWTGHSGASKLLKGLAEQKLVNNERDMWEVTPKGQKALNMAEKAAAAPVKPLPTLTPAVLGAAKFPTPMRPGTQPPMPPPPR